MVGGGKHEHCGVVRGDTYKEKRIRLRRIQPTDGAMVE